ncbi:MAG TPA: aldehyde dehydrogenase family protein, partial [Pseudomonas sp.]
MIDLNPIQPICIAGEWRLGGGELYATCYPATGEVVARLHAANLDDVEEAIVGAQRAFCESGWAQRKPHERAAVLYRIAGLIRERAEELAQLQRLDNGKPIQETRNLVASAAATFQFFAAACETLEETITPARGDCLTMSVYEPMGVVAAITPWNSPIASEAQKLAP